MNDSSSVPFFQVFYGLEASVYNIMSENSAQAKPCRKLLCNAYLWDV